jgi:hypothetical protein
MAEFDFDYWGADLHAFYKSFEAEESVEIEAVEMGGIDFGFDLWEAGVWLDDKDYGVLRGKEFHFAQEGVVFCLWDQKGCSELYLAWPCFDGLAFHAN